MTLEDRPPNLLVTHQLSSKMKHLINLSPFLLAFFVIQSCSQEEPIVPATHSVQFSFALNENQTTHLPAGSIVVLTITTPSGSPVLTDHAVDIKASDNGFVTEPIKLGTSQYMLTEFMVVHDDAALYVTPKAASEFSKNVSTPLSYALSLPYDRVVQLQVVETRSERAEKFGYRALKIQKPAQYKIMVFTRENGELTATAAWHYLIAPGIAYGGLLEPGMNTLPFNGDPQQTYNLVVQKAGYVMYSADFVYNDIRGNGNKPFKVILDRVPDENTFTINPPKTEGEFTFKLGLRGTGSLVIDWGDGTIETVTFAPDPDGAGVSYVQPSHEYANPSTHEGDKVSISGDLDKIFLLETISVYASDIDTRNLSGLETLTLYGLPINGLLDLSSNSQLQSLTFEATYAWEIRLPESHNISEVRLSDLDGILSQDVVDMIIENIYNNAIANDIMSGTFTVLRPFNISAESAERLQELAEDYGWQVEVVTHT